MFLLLTAILMIVVYAITFSSDLNKDDFETAKPFILLLSTVGLVLLLSSGR